VILREEDEGGRVMVMRDDKRVRPGGYGDMQIVCVTERIVYSILVMVSFRAWSLMTTNSKLANVTIYKVIH